MHITLFLYTRTEQENDPTKMIYTRAIQHYGYQKHNTCVIKQAVMPPLNLLALTTKSSTILSYMETRMSYNALLY